MAKVFLFGATGYIGFHLAHQLGLAGVQTTAAVRNLSSASGDRKTKLDMLQKSGVKLVEAAADDPTEDLVKLLKGFDTIVTAFSGGSRADLEARVIEAASQAGTIQRYIPSEYGGEFPIEGKHAHLTPPGIKAFTKECEGALEALAVVNIAYTKLVPYAFAGWFLPAWGQFTFPGTPPPAEAAIHGDGNVKGASTDEADIGRILAKAVNDPRTLNKKVIIKANTLTQNELLSAYEGLGKKPVPRKHVTREELDQQIKGADQFEGFVLSLISMIWFDRVYHLPTEELNTLEPVYASELYPDIKLKTVEEYYKEHA